MRTALLLVLFGCGSPVVSVSTLTPAEQAVRASMALRGLRPTLEQLEQVEADPATLDALVAEWVYDPAFGETVRDLHAESLWLRIDIEPSLPPIGPLYGRTRGEVFASVSEAPLRLVETIVTGGRPDDELLTTPDTMVDEVLADAYGLPFDPAGPEWQVTRWSDGRPAAGLLTDNGMWLRHISSDTNHHRARASAVLRALLCDDLSDRDLGVLGIDLTDPDAVADAVNTDPGCTGCHAVLDPVAATFWGYKRYIISAEVASAYLGGCVDSDSDFCYPLGFYDPATEDDWALHGQLAPGFAGAPVDDLGHLGEVIAADPRFARCTARRFVAWFEQTPLEDVSEARIDALVEVFEASGRDARELAAAVVRDPAFLAGDEPQIVRPEQYARMLEAITGFRWLADPDPPGCETEVPTCWGSVDLLNSDRYGYRVLAGGIDGYEVREPLHAPTPTSMLVVQEAALQAAGFVVADDLARLAAERRLLTQVERATVDEGSVRRQLATLHGLILGERVPAAGAVVGHTWLLWQGAHARHGDTDAAWKLAIAALLMDPKAVTY